MIYFLSSKLHSMRLAWPATLLLLLLQRTPVLRQLVSSDFGSGLNGAGQFLRAMIPTALALGAAHTLTGQTAWTTNPAGPISSQPIVGQVGTEVTVAFALSGGQSMAKSYSIVGTLPPGLGVPSATGIAGNLTLNSTSGGSISGTPTAAGNFSVVLTAFDGLNRGLGTFGASTTLNVDFTIQALEAAPAFTTHPLTQTVAYRGSVTLTVAVTGSPTPTRQWRKGTVNISGQTGTSLTLTNVGLDAAGSYDCIAMNSVGSVASNPAVITITPPVAPTISTQPIALTAKENAAAFFAVMAEGVELTYQWRKGGADIASETKSSLFLANVGSGDAANYSVRVTNPGGFIDTNAVPLTVVSSGSVRLSNLSARALVGVGGNVLIPGFVVGGSGDKTVLVRAIGPKLTDFGVGGALADPSMQLFRGATASETNDDWTAFANQTLLEDTRVAVSAFALTSAQQPQKDAAMVVSLAAGATNYTIKTVGVGDTTGVSLVELFDADPPGSSARFVNISARAQVGTGSDILIPGFFIEGDVAMTLLIRAVGPTLTQTFNVPGALADPVMTLHRISNNPTPGAQEVVTVNDDWGQTPNPAAMEAARQATFAFSLVNGSADAVLLVSLNPGGYTVKVEGKNGTTGVALMEIYLVGP